MGRKAIEEKRNLRVVVDIPEDLAKELQTKTGKNLKESIEAILKKSVSKDNPILTDEKLWDLVSTAVYSSMRGLANEVYKRVMGDVEKELKEIEDRLSTKVSQQDNQGEPNRIDQEELEKIQESLDSLRKITLSLSLKVKTLERVDSQRAELLKSFKKDLKSQFTRFKNTVQEELDKIENYKKATLKFQEKLEYFTLLAKGNRKTLSLFEDKMQSIESSLVELRRSQERILQKEKKYCYSIHNTKIVED